jgi:hypothetical protein
MIRKSGCRDHQSRHDADPAGHDDTLREAVKLPLHVGLVRTALGSKMMAATAAPTHWTAAAAKQRPVTSSATGRGSRWITSLKRLPHCGHSNDRISCRFLTGKTPVRVRVTLHAMQFGSTSTADPYWCG